MTNLTNAQFVLDLAPRGDWNRQLLPEQSAEFDLRIRNSGAESASALELSGNPDTPSIVLLDSSGNKIGSYTKADKRERKTGDLARREYPEPQIEEMAPGEDDEISLNIWSFRPPMPPGRYAVEVQHQIAPQGPAILSNRYEFQIVPATLTSFCLSYDTAERSASVLAWLGAESSPVSTTERLLVRVSTRRSHTVLMQGATSHGEFPSGSLIALGQPLWGTEETGLGWLAVMSAKQLTAIRHNLSYPYWRSEPAVLAIDEPVPINRFPDLDEHSLVLATGRGERDYALGGILFEEDKGLVRQWSVPLEERPMLSACLARAKRPVLLLLVTNDAQGSRVSRLDVMVDGRVVGRQKVVRRSENSVLAIAPAFNPNSGNAFFVLEASHEKPEQMALVTIPMSGPVRTPELQPIPGWPRDENDKAVKPLGTQIEEALDGSITIAFIDSRGFFYGGKLAPKPFVARLRGNPLSRSSFPHTAALYRNVTPGCFTAEGMLYTPGAEA